MTTATRRKTQLKLREEREQFKLSLKIHLKKNMISQRFICSDLNITDQEFHNMLTGYQSSIKRVNILSFQQFKKEIFRILCVTEI